MRNYFLCYLNISLFISISPHLRVNLILSGTLPIFPCCVCSACAIVDAQHTSVEWISSQSEFRYVVDGLQIWVVFLIIFVHSSCEYFITWSNVLFGNCSVSFSENITLFLSFQISLKQKINLLLAKYSLKELAHNITPSNALPFKINN